MRDVAERAAVHEYRAAFQRLHQIGQERILEQQCHCSVRLEVAGAHRCAVATQSHDDAPETCFEILQVGRQAENRHDLAAGNDDEPVLASGAAVHAAEPDDYRSQRAVVHVHRTRPAYPPLINS